MQPIDCSYSVVKKMSSKQRRNTLSELSLAKEVPTKSRQSVKRKQTSFCQQRRVSTDASSAANKTNNRFWNKPIRRKQSTSENSTQSSLATLFANEMNSINRTGSADSDDLEDGSGFFLWNFPFTLLESNEVRS